MTILKENIHLNEVIGCFERENQGAKAFDYTKGLLGQASHEMGGIWTLVSLTEEETWNVMLPDHRHPRENPVELIPKPGLSVLEAAARVKSVTQETGECWENIDSHRDRDFSKVHVSLQRRSGLLANLDGLHRLLAWGLFEKKTEIRAYVIGLPMA